MLFPLTCTALARACACGTGVICAGRSVWAGVQPAAGAAALLVLMRTESSHRVHPQRHIRGRVQCVRCPPASWLRQRRGSCRSLAPPTQHARCRLGAGDDYSGECAERAAVRMLLQWFSFSHAHTLWRGGQPCHAIMMPCMGRFCPSTLRTLNGGHSGCSICLCNAS